MYGTEVQEQSPKSPSLEDKKDSSPTSKALVIYDPTVDAAGVSYTDSQMDVYINIVRESPKSKAPKSKSPKSKIQGKMVVHKSIEGQSSLVKARPAKKQKVELSVAQCSQKPSSSNTRKRGNVALLCSTLKEFNDAQKNAVREMGFGHLFSWNVDTLPYGLCDWLVGKFDSASGSLRCGNGLSEIPINDQIVEQYLGLPKDGLQFDTSRVNSFRVKVWKARYLENKAITTGDVAKRLSQNTNVDYGFFLDFAVFFYSIIIEKTQNGTTSSKVLNWFDWELSNGVKNYNWCRLCRLRLCQLKAECTYISSFKVPHLLLLVLYCDRVNLYREEPERKFSIISGYSSELFKSKMNQHSNCGYDRGFVRGPPAFSPRRPEPIPVVEEEHEDAAEDVQDDVRNDDDTFAGVDLGDDLEGGPFYKFIRRQAELARIVAEYIRLFYEHIRTAPKEVQDFNTYQKINDAIEKIIKLQILCSSQHQSSQSQDSQDRFFSDPAVIECIEKIEATFLLARQEENLQTEQGEQQQHEDEGEEQLQGEEVGDEQLQGDEVEKEVEEEQQKGKEHQQSEEPVEEHQQGEEHQQQPVEGGVDQEQPVEDHHDATMDASLCDVVAVRSKMPADAAVISLSDSSEFEDANAYIDLSGKQVKFESAVQETLSDVVVDVQTAKEDENKVAIEEAETSSERTVSDPPTSSKKRRCHVELGINAIFEEVAAIGKEVVVSSTDKETSNECVQHIVQEDKGSKTEEVPKEEDLVTSAVKELSVSDQPTSSKKRRCPGDYTPPSFDLGIEVGGTEKGAVVSSTYKETSSKSVQQIVQEEKSSKTDEVPKEENLVTPAVKELSVGDQPTSSKKIRCPGDYTPPSFDLGIEVGGTEKGAVVSSTDKETSSKSVQQIVQEEKSSKTDEVPKDENLVTPAPTKRLPKLSTYVISPYNRRQVDVSSKINDSEKKLFSWIIDTNHDKSEKVFKFEGYNLDRNVFQSMDMNTYVSDDVISVWARLLNHNEIMKSPDSPLRFFCPILPLALIVFNNKEEESKRKLLFVSAMAEEMRHTRWLKPENVDLITTMLLLSMSN